jgi:hypothetical protein
MVRVGMKSAEVGEESVCRWGAGTFPVGTARVQERQNGRFQTRPHGPGASSAGKALQAARQRHREIAEQV